MGSWTESDEVEGGGPIMLGERRMCWRSIKPH